MHKITTQKGFTIIEIIVTITVLGILATIVVIGYSGYRENVEKAQIAATADAYSKSIKGYALEHRFFPKYSTCLPAGAKCCTSLDSDLPAVYCANNVEIDGSHNWAMDDTDVKITKYINGNPPTLPVVSGFPDCVTGFMEVNAPCKPTASLPNVGIAFLTNQPGGKYTSNEPSLENKGFLIYYVSPKMPCGSKDIMTYASGNLSFNSSATYTRQTSVYRECIIGLKTS